MAEYATLLAVVVGVFVTMHHYVVRSVDGGLKGLEGELNLAIVPTEPLGAIVQDPVPGELLPNPVCFDITLDGSPFRVCPTATTTGACAINYPSTLSNRDVNDLIRQGDAICDQGVGVKTWTCQTAVLSGFYYVVCF